ncbi:hypothetical protein quinque_012231 [Culex quinquefasciatus]
MLKMQQLEDDDARECLDAMQTRQEECRPSWMNNSALTWLELLPKQLAKVQNNMASGLANRWVGPQLEPHARGSPRVENMEWQDKIEQSENQVGVGRTIAGPRSISALTAGLVDDYA